MSEKNAAAQALRAIPSAKRDASVKRFVAVGTERLAEYNAGRVLKPCTCHAERADGNHESTCPVYMRKKQREWRRANKK